VIKLVGIVIVALGFALRVNALLVVVTAAIVTGLAAGFSFHEVVELAGRYFIDNRFLVLAVLLMVTVVGVLERHGLQEYVANLMRRSRAATAGRVLWLYQVVREATSMLGLSIGNHASMVRPLVAPMAEGAAEKANEQIRSSEAGATPNQIIRAHAAAAENVGNFFADDIIVAIGALLLIKGFFDTVGVEVSLGALKWWSLPTALWVLAVGWWRYRRLDRKLAALAAAAKSRAHEGAMR
jgi:uncharacterized membrane protein